MSFDWDVAVLFTCEVHALVFTGTDNDVPKLQGEGCPSVLDGDSW